MQRYVHSLVPTRPSMSGSLRSARYSSDLPDGQYEEEYSCHPPAVAMIIISILEIILYLYDTISNRGPSVDGPTAVLFIYNPYKRYQVWRYITYMFVHVGWVTVVYLFDWSVTGVNFIYTPKFFKWFFTENSKLFFN